MMDQRTVLIRRGAEILESRPGMGRPKVDSSQNRAASVLTKKGKSGLDLEVEAHPGGLVLFVGEIHVHLDEHYDTGITIQKNW